MGVSVRTIQLACRGPPSRQSIAASELTHRLNRPQLLGVRALHSTGCHQEAPKPTFDPKDNLRSRSQPGTNTLRVKPDELKQTPAQRAAAAAARAKAQLKEQEQKSRGSIRLGGLARNSFFADESELDTKSDSDGVPSKQQAKDEPLSNRNYQNMARALNPRPNARSRWQRNMVIREIRRNGRLTKAMKIAQSERSHLSRSHFFKTSMKKLAPLARQIAGKPIDEAILQMRFSNKKAAKDVRQHLVQARDEAVTIRGMGLASQPVGDTTAIITDPGNTPPLSNQNITKAFKSGQQPNETAIYVAEAWTNRGPYGAEPEYRARGRVNILRPPWTGISVLLKEEKTRTREKIEKESKQIRKRTGKNLWTQLPDRKITNQSQYVLW